MKDTHGGALILVKLEPFRLTLLHGCFPRILNCTNGTKSRKVSHILLICDFNSEISERSMHDFCNFYNLESLSNTPVLKNPSCIGLLLTNSKNNFDETLNLESGLSDFIDLSVLKSYFKREDPKVIMYWDYKYFDKEKFSN